MATIVIIQSSSIHSHTVVIMPSWSFYCRHFTIIIIVFVIQWSCHSHHLIVHIPLLCHRHCVIVIHSLSCCCDVVVMPSWSFHRHHFNFVIPLLSCRRLHAIVFTPSSSHNCLPLSSSRCRFTIVTTSKTSS